MACPACGCGIAWRGSDGGLVCYECDRPRPLEPPSNIEEKRVVVRPTLAPIPVVAEPTWVPAVERFEYSSGYGYHQERLRLMSAITDAALDSHVQLVKLNLRAYHQELYGHNTRPERITEQNLDANRNVKAFAVQISDARLPIDAFLSGSFQFEPRLLVPYWSVDVNFYLPDRFACAGHVEYYYQRKP